MASYPNVFLDVISSTNMFFESKWKCLKQCNCQAEDWTHNFGIGSPPFLQAVQVDESKKEQLDINKSGNTLTFSWKVKSAIKFCSL